MFHTTTAEGGGIAVTNGNGTVTINVRDFQKLNTLLSPLLIKIVETYKPYQTNQVIPPEYPGLEEKLDHNAVIVHAPELRENCGLMAIIEGHVDVIDNNDPGAKDTLLWAIHGKYKEVRKELMIEEGVNPSDKQATMRLIRKNSDKILLKVSKKIINVENECYGAAVEILSAARDLIVCYGFINCKILEPLSDPEE